MKRELSELLNDAKADPPPPRYGVDDVVTAGRRLRARRRAWGGAATAATVVAVAAAVAVPQLVAGEPSSAPTGLGAGSLTSPATQPAPLNYPQSRWEYAFKGYRVGVYQVNDPFLVTAGFQQATIRIGDEIEAVYGDLKPGVKPGGGPKGRAEDYEIAYSAPGSSLLLTVYRPGVFDPVLFSGGTQVTVGGRPGLFKQNIHLDGDRSRRDDGHPGLAWQYADDAWAVIYTSRPNQVGMGDFLAIARGLGGVDAYPATVAVKLTHVPSGYELASGGRGADWPHGGGEFQRTNLRLVKGGQDAAGRMTTPVIDDETSTVRDIRINLYRADFSEKRPPAGADPQAPYCNSGNANLCYRMAPGGGWQAEIEGSGEQSTTELKRVLAGLEFATVDAPSTWYPITTATR
ncbi:hypothetical protein WEI85_06145 [Actinomycetes bacterium KLBMP 9797]